jgi:hypothetical protein
MITSPPTRPGFHTVAVVVCVIGFSLVGLADESLRRLHPDQLMLYHDSRGRVRPVESRRDWRMRAAEIRTGMEAVMGPLPGKEKRCDLDVRVEEEVDCGDYVRRLITYAAEPGSRVPAYLLVPKDAIMRKRRVPGILCLHQTHPAGQKVVVGLGNSPDDEYGVELARRGYVCIAPPYPLLAGYDVDLKSLGYQSGTMKAIWNNIRALDVLEEQPFVKGDRFGTIGHSLGGHNGVFTAAFDSRLVVVVSSCGLDTFEDYMDGNITGWTSERYMPRLRNYPSAAIPFDFQEVIALLAPRTCFLSAPIGDTNFKWRSVDRIAGAARPVYRLFGEPSRLRVEHPDCEHRFPPEMRQLAYRLFDQELR